MKSFLIKVFSVLFFLSSFAFVQAANLTGVKDTITTSRPSAASPLSADAAASAGQVSIYNNGSIFLASDSAKIVKTATNLWYETLNVASQSAAKTTVYFTNALSAARNNGADVLVVPITAKHTIIFSTNTAIPATGDIEVFLPIGNATNQASPSASGFSFNGMPTNNSDNNVTLGGGTCNTWVITASTGSIKCTDVNAVAGSTTLTLTIGAVTSALINPTKTAAAGTADTWAVTVKTFDASGIELDSTKVKIGTIESVTVRAQVEPTLTFTIAGLANGTDVETNNTSCVGTLSQVFNSAIDSTATVADLGILNNGAKNYTGQDITISTNMSGGYVLTATSSGQLQNPSTGYKMANVQGAVTNNNLPVPAVMTTGTEAFGIHVCGTDVASATWGTRTNIDTDVKYANPSAIYYYTLASRITFASSVKTTVVYAGTISATTPPGLYTTVLTYVATPIF